MNNNELKWMKTTLKSIEREDEEVYELVTQLFLRLLKSGNIEVRDVVDLMEVRKEYKEKIQKKISHHHTWKDYDKTDT